MNNFNFFFFYNAKQKARSLLSSLHLRTMQFTTVKFQIFCGTEINFYEKNLMLFEYKYTIFKEYHFDFSRGIG